MNGAESLVRTILASGVDTCFANPGTSEMHFVAALDRVPGMRCILGLFEGVVTGAADGYARMAGRPAATLLHCGPGLANGLVNLHNAQKAHTPLVNIVGDQATYHKPLNPPLAAATEAWAAPISVWLRTARAPADAGALAAEAVAAARAAPGVATLVVPSDISWGEGGAVARPLPLPPVAHADEAAIADAVRVLRSGEPTLILIGGTALREKPIADAAAIAAATGAGLMCEAFNPRMERGRTRHPVDRIPYVVDLALPALAHYRHILLADAADPIAFFAYPGKPSRLFPPAGAVHTLARHGEDAAAALAALASALGAKPVGVPAMPAPVAARGKATPDTFAATLAATLPEDAVLVEEGITWGFAITPQTFNAPPHDCLQLTGGAIGIGPPLATGAAVGAPGRRVVNVEADGSALYNIQALWTQARQRLDVTTVIVSNRAYAILFNELTNVGATPGPASEALFSLSRPDLGWVNLANGFGVEAARAETLEAFADLMAAANRRRGPFLIELVA